MRSFKDKTGKEWSIEVNVTTLRRVRAKTNFLLTDLVAKDNTIGALDDPLQLFDVLYWAVNPTISEEDFGSALDDQECQRALDALVEATIDFFPQPRRDILLKAWRKTRDVLDQEAEKGARAAAKVVNSPAFESQVRKIVSTSGEPSTSSPGSSGSTRARSRSQTSS